MIDLQKRIADIIEQQCGSEIGVEDYSDVAEILIEKLGLKEEHRYVSSGLKYHPLYPPRVRWVTEWTPEEQTWITEPVTLAKECLRCHHQIDDHHRVGGIIDPCSVYGCDCIDLDLTGWSRK